MNAKLQWLRNKMASLDLQGLIITNPINIHYLTNIEAEGMLLLTRKENIYITDARYIEQVNSILTLFDEIIVYDVHDVSKDDKEELRADRDLYRNRWLESEKAFDEIDDENDKLRKKIKRLENKIDNLKDGDKK